MSKDEVIETFKWILFNRGDFEPFCGFTYDENLEVFTDADGEIEYQIRDYTNRDFKCILMRFCDDETHSYLELYLDEFGGDLYDLIYYALEEGPERLNGIAIRNLERRIRNGKS